MTETFVELADTLVLGFDVIDFLHTLTERCVELLDVDAAGILLADPRGTLNMVAASTEQARLLELFQLQNEEGPCFDAFHGGEPVTCHDLAGPPQHWPRFSAAARERGFASVHAIPMRLRDDVIGAVNLFGTEPGELPARTISVGQALADIATIGIINERAMAHRGVLVEQLQGALNSRVVIEQAKGVLAERAQIGVEEAFTLLRGYARSTSRGLSEVAHSVVRRSPDVADLLGT